MDEMDSEDSPRSKTLSGASSTSSDDSDVEHAAIGRDNATAQRCPNTLAPGFPRKREQDDEAPHGPFKLARVKYACARWCSIQHGGIAELNGSKIKCLLSRDEQGDAALMRRLVSGRELSSRIHPLIFDATGRDSPEIVLLRSLPYFQELLVDTTIGGTKFASLGYEQKFIVAVGVRDLFFAVSNGSADAHEGKLFSGMVQVLDGPVDKIQLDGMTISFHPSPNFKLIKYIEGLDYKVSPGHARLFAQVMDTPRLFAVFVDPAELSYHNFENIIPLDSWVESRPEARSGTSLSLSFSNPVSLSLNHEVFVCKLNGAASGLLKEMSSLDLYVPPLNKGTRGGERFIFHSSILSKALTEALRSSQVPNIIGEGRLGSSFEFVNYVFRCNKFVPSDARFESHRDTPYFDRARSHVSKYTMLLYLSAGQNDPVLRVQDVFLNGIEEMTCVIFDQKYEHEGRPYLDGDKIFLRTELIFKDKNLKHREVVAELFSEACYMTGQSIFNEELASHAHKCFERANSLHWAIEHSEPELPVYLYKSFQGLEFMTNGYSYWFPKNGNTVDARDCALIAVLDYFNCKVGTKPFRSISSSQTICQQFNGQNNIWNFLSSRSDPKNIAKKIRSLTEGQVESLMPKERNPNKPFTGQLAEWDAAEAEELEEREYPEDGDGCCPMHSHPMFNAWKSDVVMETYERCFQYTRNKLFGSPVLMLNQEVVINESNIKVIGDKVYFLQETHGAVLPPLNFAACWNAPDPSAFVGLDQEIVAPRLLIPPITLHETPRGYKLGLDFFRNDWMVQVDEKRTIPVPYVNEDLGMDKVGSEFLNKITEPTEEIREMLGEYWDYCQDLKDAESS